MLEYLLILGGVLLAAFHSGAETGLYCLNRLRLRLWAEKGRASARVLHRLVGKPRLAISTMLVGTNIGIYLATVMVTGKMRGAVGPVRAELYSSLLMPPILLVFAEIFPKSLFQHHADALMYKVSLPLRVSETVFYPLSCLLGWVSGLPHALLGRRMPGRRPTLTPDSFRFYLRESVAQGVLSPLQRTMVENILRLKSIDVASAMTVLAEVVMIDEDAPDGELLELFSGHRYSRIPVFRKVRERIVGVINVIDVARADEGARSVSDLAREVISLGEHTSVADALRRLRQAKQQFAAVQDDEGRALGVITVKDLVEEIVGELAAW